MFTINDGYINALTEAIDSMKSKYNQNDKLTANDLTIKNIPDIYNCKWNIQFTDLVVCEHCHSVIDVDEIEEQTRNISYDVDDWDYNNENYYDYTVTREQEYEVCPYCGYGEDEDTEFEYYPLDIDSLVEDIDTLKNLNKYAQNDFIREMKKYIAIQNNDVEIKTEANEEGSKQNTQEKNKDEDYTKLKETVKKEMYKYLKDNGIDVEHLRKAGIELNSMKSVIDKMLGTYVATSIADYENEFNIGLSWDYTIENNDIIITIETM